MIGYLVWVAIIALIISLVLALLALYLLSRNNDLSALNKRLTEIKGSAQVTNTHSLPLVTPKVVKHGRKR